MERYLAGVVPSSEIQKMQDGFTDVTMIGAVVLDIDGMKITDGIDPLQYDEEELYSVPIVLGDELAATVVTGPYPKDMESERRQEVQESVDILCEILADLAKFNSQVLHVRAEREKTMMSKSRFLASMTHEIRTPMNAIIGMSEVTLRENLTQQAQENVSQIRNSGRQLLTIIDEILDYSKLEAGKMEIFPETYEIMSQVNDLSNDALAGIRRSGRPIALTASIAPDMPCRLRGDSQRIHQILSHIVNNSLKFTKEGRIKLSFDWEPRGENRISLICEVQDTGAGIREEDMDSIFESFRQADNRRDRGVEGTGLGLTICKMLMELMGGTIEVESTYGVGTTIRIRVPQEIVDASPSIVVENAQEKAALIYTTNRYLAREVVEASERLGVFCVVMGSPGQLEDAMYIYEKKLSNRVLYFCINEHNLTREISEFLERHPNIIALVMSDHPNPEDLHLPNMRMYQTPFTTARLAMALNGIEVDEIETSDEPFSFDFTASHAHILIVDVNPVNLTVAEGLLEPLRMKIDRATSGSEAIQMVKNHEYDMIFMDHRMPGMDGVEATQVIRKEMPQYDQLPIIALTANVSGDVRNQYLEVGMNDYVGKPIELRTIVSKVRQWLPSDKIEKLNSV